MRIGEIGGSAGGLWIEEVSAWVRRVEERMERRGAIPRDRDMPSS